MDATTASAQDSSHSRTIPLRPAKASEFIQTQSAEQITSALAFTQANQDMACIFGGPGTGKTRSLMHYATKYPNVWVVTIRPATAAVVPALEEIACAVGIEEPSGGARRIGRAIESKIRGLKGIIVIDEAQHLSMAAIEEIRSLHDATGIAVALVGNETVYARMTGRTRASHFAQLFSRLGMRLAIPHPTPRDVREIAKRYPCSADALELLERIATRPGALRAVVKVLAIASKNGRATKITEDEIEAACARLGMEA